MNESLETFLRIAAMAFGIAAVSIVMTFTTRWGRSPYREPLPVADRLAMGRFFMECAITILLLGAGLWIVTTNAGSADTQKWATGMIGLVVGYWLKAGTDKRDTTPRKVEVATDQ